jgi:hypothetical protein
MSLRTTLIYEGVELDCIYEHHPEKPQTRDEPYEPEKAEVSKVFAGGVDISPLLSMEQFRQLDAMCLKDHQSYQEELRYA